MIDWEMVAAIVGVSLLFGLVVVLIIGWSQDRRWNDIHRRRMQQERMKAMEVERLLDDAVTVLNYYLGPRFTSTQTGTAESFAMLELGADVLRKHKALRGELEEVA
jgi:hypothetical protein